MKPKFIYGGGGECAGGTCPTVYQSENGNYYMQGYIVPSDVEISLPNGETVIELPKNFLENFVKEHIKELGK